MVGKQRNYFWVLKSKAFGSQEPSICFKSRSPRRFQSLKVLPGWLNVSKTSDKVLHNVLEETICQMTVIYGDSGVERCDHINLELGCRWHPWGSAVFKTLIIRIRCRRFASRACGRLELGEGRNLVTNLVGDLKKTSQVGQLDQIFKYLEGKSSNNYTNERLARSARKKKSFCQQDWGLWGNCLRRWNGWRFCQKRRCLLGLCDGLTAHTTPGCVLCSDFYLLSWRSVNCRTLRRCG